MLVEPRLSLDLVGHLEELEEARLHLRVHVRLPRVVLQLLPVHYNIILYWFFFSFTPCSTYNKIGRGNLVLRHYCSFPVENIEDMRGIQRRALPYNNTEEMKNINYFISPSGNGVHNRLV